MKLVTAIVKPFKLDEVREALEVARHKARSDKDGAHEVAMRHQSLDTQINAIKESIERFDRQVLAICANSAIRLLFQLLLLFVGC